MLTPATEVTAEGLLKGKKTDSKLPVGKHDNINYNINAKGATDRRLRPQKKLKDQRINR